MDQSTEECNHADGTRGLEIAAARDLNEVEAIRPIWEHMQSQELNPAPDADINRYLSVLKWLGADVQPHVILAQCDGRPVAMVIGRIEEHPLDFKLGYKTLLSPKLRCLTIVYGGILGEPEGDLCYLLVGEITKLARNEIAGIVK
ncbi:MAG: hypothetical protein A2Z25_20980 [Planctomycetes bacterium RBG_16_55_9]|nr:MAG: hypothetical protein A2Z25_20980 [Planctomycetes bacterium RBG_16_55_9]